MELNRDSINIVKKNQYKGAFTCLVLNAWAKNNPVKALRYAKGEKNALYGSNYQDVMNQMDKLRKEMLEMTHETNTIKRRWNAMQDERDLFMNESLSYKSKFERLKAKVGDGVSKFQMLDIEVETLKRNLQAQGELLE